MNSPFDCPFTGKSVTYEEVGGPKWKFKTYQIGGIKIVLDDYAELVLSASGDSQEMLTTSQTETLMQLIRSKLWRIQRARSNATVAIAQGGFFEGQVGLAEARLSRWIKLRIEEEANDAKTITFLERCHQTLLNLHDVWQDEGHLPEIPYSVLLKSTFEFSERQNAREDGLTYASNERLAPMVYTWLKGEGYLADFQGSQTRLVLTPKAVAEVDRIRMGREESVKQGFFIRRFDPGLDQFYQGISDEVHKETGCRVQAVWENEKNEKIDELIFRRIRESAVVVVDVTGERFNVGLEVGYALALGKPIVLLRDKDDECLRTDHDTKKPIQSLPFDISTVNCYFYDRTDPASLREKLVYRIKDALEGVRLGV